MGKIVSQFITDMMQEFGLDEANSNEGTNTDAILRYTDDANREFINSRAWTFRLKWKTQYIQGNATINTDFTTAATQIVLSSTVNWGSTGRIWVDGDIIEFTANDNINTLTIVTVDIDRNHLAGERVFLLTPVPADYNKIAELWINDFRLLKEDIRQWREPRNGTFWEIIINQTDGNESRYFMFPYYANQQKIKFLYSQKATDLTVDPGASYIEVPEPYAQFINAKVSGRIYRHLEELNLAQQQEALAMQTLVQAKAFDARQHHGIKMPIRTRWDNPREMLGYNNYNYRR